MMFDPVHERDNDFPLKNAASIDQKSGMWTVTPERKVRGCIATYHIEWLWQKSRADMICRKNFLASLGVNLPFFTR